MYMMYLIVIVTFILCHIGNFRSIEDHFPFEYDKATLVVGEDVKVFI